MYPVRALAAAEKGGNNIDIVDILEMNAMPPSEGLSEDQLRALLPAALEFRDTAQEALSWETEHIRTIDPLD